MITYTKGNLLNAKVEALVNTVNCVGVMGKGIALMFKENFPQNYAEYTAACKAGDVVPGRMFVTEREDLVGPKWIINFPTKEHWRGKTRIEWIEEGLKDLKEVIRDRGIKTVAIPPLGTGNGGLEWGNVRPKIQQVLTDIGDVQVLVFEPSREYQNVVKRKGVEKLTPARALMAELVRQYWILGIQCSLLEVHKLAWFLERAVESCALPNPLDFQFEASKYGPYAERLRHLLNSLDGSYLHCERRLADAGPSDVIWFEEDRRDKVKAYLRTGEGKKYQRAVSQVHEIIDGFQSPLGMECLSSVDWLLTEEGCAPTLESIKAGLANWSGGSEAARRKTQLFDDNMIELAIGRLKPFRQSDM